MSNSVLDRFINHVIESLQLDTYVKLSLKNKKNKEVDLQQVIIRYVSLNKGMHFSFTYRHPTKDITKNYKQNEGINVIKDLLNDQFFQADLLLKNKTVFFNSQAKTKMTVKENTISSSVSRSHDKAKSTKIKPDDKLYLKRLGITSSNGIVIGEKRSKYKQINKYLEILENLITKSGLNESYTLLDMGSGKAYLTFALFDYLTNELKHTVKMVGVELRKELVENSNVLAKDCGFSNLSFELGSIEDSTFKKIDILIALHACDTATDEAIYKGIRADAKIIMCSPCCHKQIRKQLDPENALAHINQYGILMERQAELITDTIRTLILESFGYKSKVIEFISTEHTSKNLMIIAVKDGKIDNGNSASLAAVKSLKKIFGIQSHYLETLLEI